jgi:hypothetical protein
MSLDWKYTHRYKTTRFDYSNGDPTATVTYIDIDDAIKARAKLIGTTQLTGGRIVRNESDASPSSRRGKEIRFPYR